MLAGPGEVADAAVSWLRIALFGVPFVLVTMAGNGWMRGVQDTRRPLRYVLLGNGISAALCPVLVYGMGLGTGGLGGRQRRRAGDLRVAVLCARWSSSGCRCAPGRPGCARSSSLGRDLVLRSLAFQACFVSATTVAAHSSTAAVGAHQVVLQLWTFLALVLDSLAIAAQSLVGAALGADDDRRARGLAWQVTGYGLIFGCALGVLFAALAGVLPRVFTSDASVLAEIPHAWWFFVAMQPVAGVVFALDGVLLGAGDAAFLRNATLLSAAVGFLPLVWASFAFGWGLTGIWVGLTAFMLVRLATVLLRARSGRWAVLGAVV